MRPQRCLVKSVVPFWSFCHICLQCRRSRTLKSYELLCCLKSSANPLCYHIHKPLTITCLESHYHDIRGHPWESKIPPASQRKSITCVTQRIPFLKCSKCYSWKSLQWNTVTMCKRYHSSVWSCWHLHIRGWPDWLTTATWGFNNQRTRRRSRSVPRRLLNRSMHFFYFPKSRWKQRFQNRNLTLAKTKVVLFTMIDQKSQASLKFLQVDFNTVVTLMETSGYRSCSYIQNDIGDSKMP